MRCREAEAQLLLCRNESELAARPALQSHVRGCPQCLKAWQACQQLNGLLNGLSEDQPGGGFVDRVAALVEAEPAWLVQPPVRRGWLQGLQDRLSPAALPRLTDWALAMVATFAVFTLGTSLLLGHGSLVAQAGSDTAAAFAWMPRLGWLMVDYAQRLVTLLGAS